MTRIIFIKKSRLFFYTHIFDTHNLYYVPYRDFSWRHRFNHLERKVHNRMAEDKKSVVVIGLGYVGLPLATHFAKCGFSVIGLDKDPNKIESLKENKSYIPDVSDQELVGLYNNGLFRALFPEDGKELLKSTPFVIVTVPTPLGDNNEPDLSFIISSSNFIRDNLQQGQTIIYESSTYPGTLEEVILPILEQTGKKVGKDFYLGYSPERIDPSNTNFTLASIPKVVSGQTDECLKQVLWLYEQTFDKPVPVSSPKVAEMCKLFENIQRLVNISLVNEVFLLCKKLNIDFYQSLQAAATKPFGFTPYWPGPGIGGHCIPVDPIYFQWKLNQYGMRSRMIEVAEEINNQMPQEVVNQIKESLPNKIGKVLLIGMAYKKDVNDLRESPSLDIFELLVEEGMEVSYYDPYFPKITIKNQEFVSVELSTYDIQKADTVVILTDHSTINWKQIKNEAKRIVDTRGVLRFENEEDSQ